jgi:GDP-4-dehydro-6-deoxy-D-mannose reductase
VLAAAKLLSVAASLARPPRILIVGSAAQYGVTAGGHEVVDEERPLLGRTPYAVSKTLPEKWALVYAREKSLSVVCVRPFNLMGPGQPEGFVPVTFLRQVADVLDGRAAEVLVGNIETQRDFIDVRDLAAALWALMAADDRVAGQVFNIASGQPVRIRDMLDACVELGGQPVIIREDPARVRPNDVPVIVGDATKLRSLTGWQPQVPWRQSLADTWCAIRGG